VNTVLPLTDEAVEKASDIYAAPSARGGLIGDADMLIAGCALTYGLVLATNNESHFASAPGLLIVNSQKP